MRCSLFLGLILFVWAFCTLGTDLLVFSEQGCPQCGRLEEFLERVSTNYPGLNILRYEIHDPDAQDLLDRLLAAYGAELGSVPILFIGDVAAVGGTYYGLRDEPYAVSGRVEELALQEAIDRAIDGLTQRSTE